MDLRSLEMFWHNAFTQAWQLTLLVVVVHLITRFVVRHRPQLAYALWLIVLVKCVTPPLWGSPTGAFCWLQARVIEARPQSAASSSEPANEALATTPRGNLESQPVAPDDSPIANTFDQDYDSANASLPVTAEGRPSDTLAVARGGASFELAGLLVGVWLTGTALVVVVAVSRMLHCVRRLHRSASTGGDELDQRLAEIAARLALRRPVRVRINSSQVGPAVVGLLRPTILLPACLVENRSVADLEPLLAHELVHVRRGDLWAGLLQLLAQAVWWFHPLVWFAGRAASREAERCCDEEVVAELGYDPLAYARGLLDVLELRHKLRAVPAFPGVRPIELTSQRLERIMTLGQGCRRRRVWGNRLLMVLAAAIALPGAALVVADTEPAAHHSAAIQEIDAESAQTKKTDGQDETSAMVDDEHRSTRSYESADLIAMYRQQTGVSDEIARTVLLSQLDGAVTVDAQFATAARGYWGSSTGKREFAFRSRDGAQIVKLPTPDVTAPELDPQAKPTLKWSGSSIYVRGSAGQHLRVAKALDDLRNCDFSQNIELTVWWAAGDVKLIDRLSPSWMLLSAAAGAADDAWSEEPPPGESQATLRIERNLPIKYALLDEKASQAAIEGLQADPRTNVLQAPRFRFSSGQTTTIQDMTYSPFVVDVRDIQGKAFEPVIRVYSEGTAIRVRGLRKNNAVRLDFDLLFSAIRDVETAEVAFGGERDAVTLQVPEVARVHLRSSIDIALGKTLVIAGLKRFDRSGKPQPAAVLLTVKDSPDAPANPAKQAAPQTNRHAPGVGTTSDAGIVGQSQTNGDKSADGVTLDTEPSQESVSSSQPATESTSATADDIVEDTSPDETSPSPDDKFSPPADDEAASKPQTIRYVRVYGSELSEKTLVKRAGLKIGDQLEPAAIEVARSDLQKYLNAKGHPEAVVSILEGAKATDHGVRLLVRDPNSVSAEKLGLGFTLASKQQNKSKFIVVGQVDQEKLDDDVRKLTDYYRGLGFFRARVGREWTFDKESQTMQVKFIVDEQERYVIDKIEVVGNAHIPFERLAEGHKLKSGDFYSKAAVDKEVARIKEVYGDQGYLLATVEAEPRFSEQPGKMDIVLRVVERTCFRIRSIDFELVGQGQADRREAIGKLLPVTERYIASATKLRQCERILKASAEIDLADGRPLKVVFRPVEGAPADGPDDVLHADETVILELAPTASNRAVDPVDMVK